MAEIRICDTGCGIPEKDLENIFKRFYRADSSRTLPGNGLGLSLVHAIVEAHHGKIHVASSEKGSIFTVCLPLCWKKTPTLPNCNVPVIFRLYREITVTDNKEGKQSLQQSHLHSGTPIPEWYPKPQNLLPAQKILRFPFVFRTYRRKGNDFASQQSLNFTKNKNGIFFFTE